MATYPTAVKTFTTKSDGAGNTIAASHVNDMQDEITAIEDGLLNGTAPLNSSRITAPSMQVTNSTVTNLTVSSLTISAVTLGASTTALAFYQHGTWTPTLTGSSAGSPAYTAREGYYVRVGRAVTIQARVILSSTGGMDGALRMTGMPYGINGAVAEQALTVANILNGGSSYGGYYAIISGPQIEFKVLPSTGGQTYTNMPSSLIGNTFYVTIGGTYLTT